jgi:glycolate dehydrogenase FAD-linked subunit
MAVERVVEELEAIVGAGHAESGEEAKDEYFHDEALGLEPVTPRAVVRPGTAEETRGIIEWANATRTPLTPRGSGTGLSGACIPRPDGVVVAFERMNQIAEIDEDNHVAVVAPGVTLEQLDRATEPLGLIYPVFPGESSASLGGNVATNAGGMRAVKYGVTRHQVLGLDAVLGTGEIIRTGGRFVKATSGYDLTQLIVGSEGTLALVTQAVLRLYPRPRWTATILAPFETLSSCTGTVPGLIHTGVGPLMVEYIDQVTMAALNRNEDLELGIPQALKDRAVAYLVVVLENTHEDRLSEDTERIAARLGDAGALDVFVLPPHAGTQLIKARERAFWTTKAAGANDVLDVVVPRGDIAPFMEEVAEVARATGSFVPGCGHAGDGNVHLAVFQPDPQKRTEVIEAILRAGVRRGGAISGEHGIGLGKRKYLAALEDPAKLALWRRIKTAFDPNNVLNPGAIFE